MNKLNVYLVTLPEPYEADECYLIAAKTMEEADEFFLSRVEMANYLHKLNNKKSFHQNWEECFSNDKYISTLRDISDRTIEILNGVYFDGADPELIKTF